MKDMYFSDECTRIERIINEYQPKCKEYFESVAAQTVTEQYCYGGDIHRGFYNPSLIEDIIIGNVKRGRLTKKQKNNSRPAYVYGFDEQNKLTTVTGRYGREFIIYNKDCQIGITFDKYGIIAVCESEYENNMLKSYTYYMCNSDDSTVIDLRREVYTYSKNELAVDVYSFLNYKNTEMEKMLAECFKDCPYTHQKECNFDHTRYIFSIDGDYLKTYRIEEYDNEKRIPSMWDNRIFKVNKKRVISNQI